MRKYCVITLRSVFVQGIRALDTLSPYIYYELLVLVMGFKLDEWQKFHLINLYYFEKQSLSILDN